MATTFVNVPDLEQQYDLWEAGLLWVHMVGLEPKLCPGRTTNRSKEDLLSSWAETAKNQPDWLYGYMAED